MKDSIHFMAADIVDRKIESIESELIVASRELDEALKLGDLRENSQYDDAKSKMNRLIRAKEEYLDARAVPQIKDSDTIDNIGAGSILHVIVHSVTTEPLQTNSSAFAELKNQPPIFEGKLIYGGIPSFLEMMEDNAFSEDSPLGEQLMGKLPGDYSLAVPAGYANLTVRKIPSSTPSGELFCRI